ncbi:MAG: glycosyltransferase family 2 protein [Phycisphaerae bacterium]|nr:glycosyltransferase family 2 protein [Phycisphaerae bacterium]
MPPEARAQEGTTILSQANPVGYRRSLVISPVRNEAEYLQRTIDSMVAQTVRPAVWLIVDDGSTDATPGIAARAAEQHEWIRLYRRPDRGVRKLGGGVIEAFDEGLALFDLTDFDYVCKLDGDLEFRPTYFERLFEKFEADPRLGTASGKCWLVTDNGMQLERTGDEFSLGAAKLYRVECFRQIGGFVRKVMWDGIDCHRCRMLGWRAASIHDADLRIRHLRRMGSSHHSVLRGRLRWGYGQYFMGTHPLYALAITVYRMFERPWIIGGLLIGLGYLGSWLRGAPRCNDFDFRRFLRRWQMARLGLFRRPLEPE